MKLIIHDSHGPVDILGHPDPLVTLRLLDESGYNTSRYTIHVRVW